MVYQQFKLFVWNKTDFMKQVQLRSKFTAGSASYIIELPLFRNMEPFIAFRYI